MRVLIISAQGTSFEDMAQEVVLPGDDGEVCILDFHQPFLQRLQEGVIRIDKKKQIFVRDGVAKMNNNELVVLAEIGN